MPKKVYFIIFQPRNFWDMSQRKQPKWILAVQNTSIGDLFYRLLTFPNGSNSAQQLSSTPNWNEHPCPWSNPPFKIKIAFCSHPILPLPSFSLWCPVIKCVTIKGAQLILCLKQLYWCPHVFDKQYIAWFNLVTNSTWCCCCCRCSCCCCCCSCTCCCGVCWGWRSSCCLIWDILECEHFSMQNF